MLVELVGSVHVQVIADSPSDADWDAMLDSMLDGQKTSPMVRVLVSAEKGAPNAAQRKRLADRIGNRKQRGAVLTESAVVRGALTAIRWFNPNINTQAFSPRAFDEAVDYLDVATAEGPKLRAAIDRLRAELGLGPLK